MNDDDGSAATDGNGGPAARGTDVESGNESGEGYGGVFGTYPYAFRRSRSRLFRSYIVVGGLVTVLIVVVFGAAFVQFVAATTGTPGGTVSFARAFLIVLGLLVVVPLMAPVLVVARRHRRRGSSFAYDRALAAGGYLFLVSLYVALVVAAPPALRDEPPAALAPVVAVLYGLPPLAAVVAPVVAVAVGYLLHRRYR